MCEPMRHLSCKLKSRSLKAIILLYGALHDCFLGKKNAVVYNY
uniref:Uncharacterized protein n=1 Tax=Anguilla anguilla TaxID=7936 RepID=A0A0E9XUA8_ANGAN